MGAELDRLEIKVESNARSANTQLDSLISKLNGVKSSLTGLNGSGLQGLSNGVAKLSTAMQGMNSVKTTDFTRLASNITKLANVRPAALNYTADSLTEMAKSLSGLSSVSKNAIELGEVVKSIAKFGNKSTSNAITNMPLLGKALTELMTTLSKAPNVSSNLIKMTTAMANLSAQGSKVGSASKSMANGLKSYDSSAKNATVSSKSLASQIGKLYANYYVLIKAFKGLGSAITSSMDYIEQYNFYNVTMGKVSDEWSKDYAKYGYENAQSYGDSFQARMTETISKMSGFNMNANGTLTDTQSSNLGLDVTSLTNYSAGLEQVTNSLGLTGEAGTTTAKALTMLSGDMSSFRNLSQSSIQTAFTSGLIGQSRALYKLGIDTTVATLQQYAYDAGIEKSVKDMTQGEKMQLRAIAILDQSKAAYGDLANTIMSPSNQLRLLQNNFAALSRTIGNMFLPVVASVLPYVNGLVIAIRRLFDWVSSMLGVDLSKIIGQSSAGYSDALGELADNADETSDSIDGVADSAKNAKNAFLGIDEINPLGSDSSSSTTNANKEPIDLTNALSKSLADYQSVWDAAFGGLNNTANQYANDIIGFFEGIAKYAEPSVKAVENLWNDGLSKFGTFAWDTLGSFVSDFLIPIGKWTLGEGLPRLLDVANNLIKSVKWSSLSNALSNLFKALAPFAINVGKGLITFIEGLAIVLKPTISVLSSVLAGALNVLAKAIGAIPENVVKSLGAALGGFITTLLVFATLAKAIDMINNIKIAFGSFLNVLEMNKVMLIVGAVVALVSAISAFSKATYDSSAIGQYVNKTKELAESTQLACDNTDKLIKTNKDSMDDANAQAGSLEFLSQMYYHLADKQNLSADEQKRLVGYAKTLIGQVPELSGLIDDQTGAYKGTKEEIEKLITKTQEYYMTQAAEADLVEAYKQKYSNIKDLGKATDALKDSQKKLSDANAEYARIQKDAADKGTQSSRETINALNAQRETVYGLTTSEQINQTAVDNLTSKQGELNTSIQYATDYMTNYGVNSTSVAQVVSGAQTQASSAVTGTAYATVQATNTISLCSANVATNVSTSMGSASGSFGNLATNASNSAINISNAFTNVASSLAVSGYNATVSFLNNFHADAITSTAYNAVNGIATAFSQLDLSAYGARAGSTFIESLSQKLSGTEIQLGMNPSVTTGNMALTISRIKPPGYATGGFPTQGQIFMARENGPELVGTSSNGSSMVANNSQIEGGIAQAVGPAVYEAVVMAMNSSGGGSNSNQPMTVQSTIIVDGKVWASITTDAQQHGDRIFNAVAKA